MILKTPVLSDLRPCKLYFNGFPSSGLLAIFSIDLSTTVFTLLSSLRYASVKSSVNILFFGMLFFPSLLQFFPGNYSSSFKIFPRFFNMSHQCFVSHYAQSFFHRFIFIYLHSKCVLCQLLQTFISILFCILFCNLS